MDCEKRLLLEFDSKSENEGFARMMTSAFIAGMDPTLEELADVKTAVSEAVTNAIIHGYRDRTGTVTIRAAIHSRELFVEISDTGVGIEDVCQAMVPLYTTRPDMERSGMGFSFMEAFMDELEVHSGVGEGTRVRMKKKISGGK
ncbi:MAG: anti-sigma F factor [Lachnospiraceae bacterium]|nr:anti-sigma F factor [Lachnospiraceae bacterium]